MERQQGKNVGLGKQKRMKFVHESVIERGKIFEALGTGLFEAFEKENLRPRVDLFQELAQLSHGIAAGRDTEDIVHEALDKLLSQVFAGQIAIREFSSSKKFIEGYGLRSKWDRWLLTRGHADDTSVYEERRTIINSTGPPGVRQVRRRFRQGLSRKTGEDRIHGVK